MVFSEARPQMATVRNNTFLVNENLKKSAQVISISSHTDPASLKKKVVGLEKAAGTKLDITEAEIVVAAGRGIKAPENFKIMEELADVLNASVGTTRATVDEGWRDLERSDWKKREEYLCQTLHGLWDFRRHPPCPGYRHL